MRRTVHPLSIPRDLGPRMFALASGKHRADSGEPQLARIYIVPPGGKHYLSGVQIVQDFSAVGNLERLMRDPVTEGDAGLRQRSLSKVKSIGERAKIPHRSAGRQVREHSLKPNVHPKLDRISGVIEVRGH